ncbi:uncharacterized protein BJX67DRAFT_379274 [Aspergillus lucknowensis]|uniref:Uncharacterized protein n=1 Tax=Aspergillus lucknowensis TaxID=176173 RepID=A0ABR4LXL6_9EURO
MAELYITEDMLEGIKGKVVLITGGTSGIGLATAQLCLQHGAQFDVSDWTSLRAFFDEAISSAGRIDHVFANAGIGPTIDFQNDVLDALGALVPPDLRALNVNLVGAIYTLRLAMYYFRRFAQLQPQPGTRSIVFTASAASYANNRAADYTTSKHGVLGILRGLVAHLDPAVMRMNAVAPSWTVTSIVSAALVEQMASTFQSPEAVARSVLLLFADQTRHNEVIYSYTGRFREINLGEGGILASARRTMQNPVDEDEVSKALFEMGGR